MNQSPFFQPAPPAPGYLPFQPAQAPAPAPESLPHSSFDSETAVATLALRGHLHSDVYALDKPTKRIIVHPYAHRYSNHGENNDQEWEDSYNNYVMVIVTERIEI